MGMTKTPLKILMMRNMPDFILQTKLAKQLNKTR